MTTPLNVQIENAPPSVKQALSVRDGKTDKGGGGSEQVHTHNISINMPSVVPGPGMAGGGPAAADSSSMALSQIPVQFTAFKTLIRSKEGEPGKIIERIKRLQKDRDDLVQACADNGPVANLCARKNLAPETYFAQALTKLSGNSNVARPAVFSQEADEYNSD
jgi:hypothetical protein